MTYKEYQHKKRECWEDFCRHIVDEEEEFYNIFDRAYALGREKESITQEEIEKAAKDYAYYRSKSIKRAEIQQHRPIPCSVQQSCRNEISHTVL